MKETSPFCFLPLSKKKVSKCQGVKVSKLYVEKDHLRPTLFTFFLQIVGEAGDARLRKRRLVQARAVPCLHEYCRTEPEPNGNKFT